MALATVTVEHADGTTELWNITQKEADTLRGFIMRCVGAPDITD